MFPLGHLGFSLLAWRGVQRARSLASRSEGAGPADAEGVDPRWFAVPWVLLGAVLPDLVDKPLGHLVLALDNGRLVAHTLVFVLLLAGVAWVLHRRGWTRGSLAVAAVAFGAGMHLVLDRMWQDPRTLLWPLLGWRFPSMEFEAVMWVEALLHDPSVFVPEVLGGLVLAWEAGRWWGARSTADRKGVGR